MEQIIRSYHDFLKDESFKNWVQHPNKENNEYWQEYRIVHSQEEEAIRMARQIILSIHFEQFEGGNDNEQQQVLRNIISNRKSQRAIAFEKEQINSRQVNKISRYWSVAASVFLAIGLSFYFWINNHPVTEEEISVAIVVKENSGGRKSTILLPDGTLVKLNSESKLSYPEVFDSTKRVVYLKGEAYFEVAKNPKKPFSVVSGDIRTTALGTAFNVQAWEGEPTIQVALAEGKVRIDNLEYPEQTDQYFLDPGQKIIHHDELGAFKVMTFNPVEEYGWKDGILLFHQTNLQEFVKRLSRWYGVTFKIQGVQNDSWSIDGRFENESLKEILESLSYTYKIKYELKNKEVILRL